MVFFILNTGACTVSNLSWNSGCLMSSMPSIIAMFTPVPVFPDLCSLVISGVVLESDNNLCGSKPSGNLSALGQITFSVQP